MNGSSTGGTTGGPGSSGIVIVTEFVGAAGGVAISVPDAPIDGQIYGRNNGTWTTIIQGGQSGTVNTGVAGQLAIYPATGTTVGPATAAQATAVLNVFTPALAGLVPFSGGGPLNFLRADGIWTIPPGGSGSGTVSTGTLNQIAYYNTAGTTVQGETLLQALNMPAFTGDVTNPAGSLVNTIATGIVSNAKLATMPAMSFKANSIGVAGPPQDISASAATAMLSQFTSVAQGVVPLSGGGTLNFLRADGLWAAPPGGAAGQNPGGGLNSVQFNNSGAFGGYTNTQLTSLIQPFTATLGGAVSASGGGTTNFLRADGVWAAAGMFIASFLNNPLNTFNVYVATTGNDANPGTAALPFRTIQKGVNALLHAVCPQSEYGAVQLNVADGSYNEQVFCGPTFGTFIIQGNTNNPQNVVVTSSGPVFIFAGPASWILSGFELHGTNSFGKFGLVDNVGNMCSVLIGSCNFGNNAGAPHVTSTYNGDGNCGVTTIEAVKIVGSATALFGSASGGYCELSHGTVDCNGLNPWTTAVITCGQNGRALIRAVPDFSWINAGAVTVPKVNCSDGGRVIFDNMVEVPGTAPVIETGGWVYDNNNNVNARIIGPSFTGDSGSGGKIGYVPAPVAGDAAAGKFLKADATWAVPAGGGSSGIAIGTTPITGGTTTRVLYDLSGTVQEATNFTIIGNNPNITLGGQLLYNGAQVLQAQPAQNNMYTGGAGNLTGTGTNNFGSGSGTLTSVTTGTNNFGAGSNALHALTTGVQSVAIGGNAMALEQTHGHCVAIGFGALSHQTGADFNIAIGVNAGFAITTGDGNLFLGPAAGNVVTTGRANVVLGGYQGDSPTMSNNIIFSDGDTNVQMQYNNGWLMGAATGGGQGPGTLNVAGNIYKNGVPIGTGGGGSGTVGSGTTNQLAFYSVAGTSVVGETLLQAVNMPALTGDLTGIAGSLSVAITNSVVNNAKLANMAPGTIKGNNGASTAPPLDLTTAQVSAMLGGRTILSAATSYYVNAATGNDTTGNGSSGAPWLTLQKANNFLRNNIDFGGQRVDLIMQVAGTYTGPSNMGGYVGSGVLSIHGATNVPASYVVIDPGFVSGACFDFSNGDTLTQVRFDNLTFKPQSGANDCIKGAARANIFVAGGFSDGLGQTVGIDFTGITGSNCNGFSSSNNCDMTVGGTKNVTVPLSGKTIFFMYAALGAEDNQRGGGRLIVFGNTNFSGSLTVGHYAAADTHAYLEPLDTIAFTAGSCTGPRFFVEYGAIINTFGGGHTALPGSTSGIMKSGGQYL
jgi:hypothetical protein